MIDGGGERKIGQRNEWEEREIAERNEGERERKSMATLNQIVFLLTALDFQFFYKNEILICRILNTPTVNILSASGFVLKQSHLGILILS